MTAKQMFFQSESREKVLRGATRLAIEKTTFEYDREKLQKRLAKLAGGVAVIRVGAPSEAEMKSRKEALDDAISATKAAMVEGVVPGGGLTLLRGIDAVECEEATSEGDERTGLRLLMRALETPTRQIAENSGCDGGDGQLRQESGSYGFDVATGKYVDLVEAGIIDATKVVRLGLENAVSVAGTLLLAEATMTELPEENTRHNTQGRIQNRQIHSIGCRRQQKASRSHDRFQSC